MPKLAFNFYEMDPWSQPVLFESWVVAVPYF